MKLLRRKIAQITVTPIKDWYFGIVVLADDGTIYYKYLDVMKDDDREWKRAKGIPQG